MLDFHVCLVYRGRALSRRERRGPGKVSGVSCLVIPVLVLMLVLVGCYFDFSVQRPNPASRRFL